MSFEVNGKSFAQAPQSPASQPFFTPKWPSSRRKVRRH